MTPEIRARLAKVYELVRRGATAGERAAAQLALDRLIDRHNLHGVDLDSLDKNEYYFTYGSKMECELLFRIIRFFTDTTPEALRAYRTRGTRTLGMLFTYLDYITVEAAYGYFRRHMRSQWAQTCARDVKRCRTDKSRAKRRARLQELFFTQYLIASKLVSDDDLQTVTVTSQKEIADRQKLAGVEGGQYHRQVVGGLFLEQKRQP
jgi:hypothetical protein